MFGPHVKSLNHSSRIPSSSLEVSSWFNDWVRAVMMVIEQDTHAGMFSVKGGGNCGACRVDDHHAAPRVMAGATWHSK